MTPTDKAGLYLHIPFCAGKCPYCDFYSMPSTVLKAEYISSLKDELRTLRRTEEFISKSEISIDSVYFGGGTPSALEGEDIAEILSAVRDGFLLSDESEISVECNPSSKNLGDFLRKCALSGVNRISLGLQSANDGERKRLGRKGNAKAVENAVYAARNAGIDNISLDIMLGIPESTTESLKTTLNFALSLNVSHISCYILKLEKGTFFYKNAGKLNLPDEDAVCDMYLYVCAYLKKNGFRHYEISNFCREGFFSRHNMKYWTNVPYIGLGPSAHSFYGGRRFFFPRDIKAFIDGKKARFEGLGGGRDEILMLSLRTDKGIKLLEYSESFNKKAEFFAGNGFAIIEDGKFSLTDKGFLVSNYVITELLLAM